MVAAETNEFDRLQWYFDNWDGVGAEADDGGNNALHRASRGSAKRTVKLCLKVSRHTQLKLGGKDYLWIRADSHFKFLINAAVALDLTHSFTQSSAPFITCHSSSVFLTST